MRSGGVGCRRAWPTVCVNECKWSSACECIGMHGFKGREGEHKEFIDSILELFYGGTKRANVFFWCWMSAFRYQSHKVSLHTCTMGVKSHVACYVFLLLRFFFFFHIWVQYCRRLLLGGILSFRETHSWWRDHGVGWLLIEVDSTVGEDKQSWNRGSSSPRQHTSHKVIYTAKPRFSATSSQSVIIYTVRNDLTCSDETQMVPNSNKAWLGVIKC